VKPNLIIIRYSEIGLKAKFTRKTFENILQKNIKDILKKKTLFLILIKPVADFIFIQKKSKKQLLFYKKYLE